jgi:hypothetical protein
MKCIRHLPKITLAGWYEKCIFESESKSTIDNIGQDTQDS